MTCSQIVNLLESKISLQVERAGFKLQLQGCKGNPSVLIDEDAFLQIVINLVDNAIKFSAKADNKQVDITFEQVGQKFLAMNVRDYGPGIPKADLKKIFTLFYRRENELTREAQGTGIGLALVDQLTRLLNGKIDVINCQPGTQFRILFPLQEKD